MPVISVIIPTYNAETYILETVKSVLEGELNDIEVIVVDDGSTDDTRGQVQQLTELSSPHHDPRVRYIYQKNTGKAGAVNHAFDVMTGDFVTIVDADDFLPAKSLSARYRAIKGLSKTHASVGSMVIFDQTEKRRGFRTVPEYLDPAYLYKSFFYQYKSPFSLNQLLISREVIEEVGKFNVGLERCQDIEYLLRLLRLLDRIIPISEPVYVYRKHRSSSTQRIRIRLKTIRDRIEAYRSAYNPPLQYAAVICGLLLDLGKLAFELKGNYGK